MNRASTALKTLAVDEEGSEVVEYALIVALVSIVLALALGNATNGLGSAFGDLVTRVRACFAPGATTC